PFVRGESLRQKLAREVQLTVDEAVTITTQVASALNYAHAQGVIHRDVKPENILLHEGEAMLADFGIALAVEQAGGTRLSQTGFSPGTPQYMSPEQATGGRQVDARSDEYSLAAVVYEMLAGEPPHTGPSVQAVIAKLLTERPSPIRTVRDSIPEGIEGAVAKALAKVPADRFHGAAEFAAALAAPAARRPRRVVFASTLIGAVALATVVWLALRAPARQNGSTLVVHSRSQLTFTGNATSPAISEDGTQLAYVVRQCRAAGCTYEIVVQDVAGGGTRSVVTGASALYGVGWSPDRRFLQFVGTIASRYGTYVVATLGSPPRYLGNVYGRFYPSGDSLLVASGAGRRGAAWVWTVTLDGDRHDSVLVQDVDLPAVAPLSDGWILVQSSILPGIPEWRIIDWKGRVRDRLRLAEPLGLTRLRVSGGALWVEVGSAGAPQSVVLHETIDARRGRFVGRPDTALIMPRDPFDIAAGAGTVVYSEGSDQYEVWALTLHDALRGWFPEQRRVFSSTGAAAGVISPDGSRILVVHSVPSPSGERDMIEVVPFPGGTGVTHRPSGSRIAGPRWTPDGTTFWYAESVDSGVRFAAVDARSGARRSTVPIADSSVEEMAPLGVSGLVWTTGSANGVRVWRAGEGHPRDLPIPEGDESVWRLGASRDGARVVTVGWNATEDSMLVHELSLVDGRATHWATFFGESASRPVVLADGSVMIAIAETRDANTLYRLRGPGHVERVGTIPRPLIALAVSVDGRRVVVTTSETRGDIWLARVGPAGSGPKD
ncbi:MAG TPA: protein kinase, partial [Gemmatimonadales bacterium]|nr:protein kinase [Gemmatimonadales bacterium]